MSMAFFMDVSNLTLSYKLSSYFLCRFIYQDDKPAVLRGPMVNSAFDKMLLGTDWGKLDVLVVDMPPGGM